MADSLFDNRYRYDHIFPRGRSGETLRAFDTRAQDRPVIIKRPAPNDAPPIRAGQEISILNERRALQRMSGHPLLTELLGSGQFPIGGMPHQYIVMERAVGDIVADTVLALKANGQYLPELELLVILDNLLDLLQLTHQRDIVYNDVDAWHLFWDRDAWQLKVIDWGNAVFLEGDESTPQGVSRQSDVGQVGELLYFLLTGGRRIELPRDAGNDYRADFGPEADRVSTRLQSIVSRAAHPRLQLRYPDVATLRKELADYRGPLQRERDLVLNRVSGRLRHDRSRDELHGLMQTLAPALAADPGYPQARELQQTIEARLQDIAIAADLDAIRIYMENGNWQRSAELLSELRPRADGENSRLVRLLGDMARLLQDAQRQDLPALVQDSIALLFDGQVAEAAQELITRHASEPDYELQHLLAERISAHFPDVQLLQPNLLRVRLAMGDLAYGGQPVSEPQVVLDEVMTLLQGINANPRLAPGAMQERYSQVCEALESLQTLLDSLGRGQPLPGDEGLGGALQRALLASRNLARNLQIIGNLAASSPREATTALADCQVIDPANSAWAPLQRRLDALYEFLGTCQTWVPLADGSGLDNWLRDTRSDLKPFLEFLFDPLLHDMVNGLDVATSAWDRYAMATLQGNRASALDALTQASEAVQTLSPTLSSWFIQLRSVVAGARYVERHALFGGLGRALADGWQTWDRGQLAEAARLAQRAREIARNNPQREAADRLARLADASRIWVERNGVASAEATRTALAAAESLLTEEELKLRDDFAQQMPGTDTFLKAMNRGLVDLVDQQSTAALRILFFYFLLRGAEDAQENDANALENAAFWHEAALRTLGDDGPQHVAARALESFISRRQDLLDAAGRINEINGPDILPRLATIADQLEANPQARLLAPAILSLAEFQAALRDWTDGEFRPAGVKLENAMNAIDDAEQAAAITLTGYRTWLVSLQAGAAELHTRLRRMNKVIEEKPDTPDNALLEAHRWLVSETERLLSPEQGKTLRQWQTTYERFLATHIDPDLSRSARLTRFNDLFRVMFIDRHPAWPLYRHWFELTEHQSEFSVAPGTQESLAAEPAAARQGRRQRGLLPGGLPALSQPSSPPQPGAEPSEPTRPRPPEPGPDQGERSPVPFSDDDEFPELPESAPAPRRISRQVTVVALIVVVLAILALVFVYVPGRDLGPGQANPVVTTVPTMTPVDAADAPAAVALPASATPLPDPTGSPTVATLAPSATARPAHTATPLRTATPLPGVTLPPLGLQGRQNLLTLLASLAAGDALNWPTDAYRTGDENGIWHLGREDPAGDGPVVFALAPDALDAAWGNQAATRIRRMEVTLVLGDYDPTLLQEESIWFGATLQVAGDSQMAAGARVRLVQPGVINLSQHRGSELRPVGQRTVNAVVARLRLERDMDAGSVRVFLNDETLGEPVPMVPGEALQPVLYVQGGGVIVSVTDWQITLSPG
ncbi:MAG: hypothetical protein OXF63_12215 [Anaerolineaceae bacterium]|nr:hypothetical protein [Anaerolineaceae bacterium]